MVLCSILKSNCAGIVSNHRGEGSQMRTVLPCRRDNNHPFFTRSCGRATTKELSTMENKFVASEMPTGNSSSFSFLFRFNVTRKIDRFVLFRVIPICKKLAIYSSRASCTLSYTSFRNFVAEEGTGWKKENRKNRMEPTRASWREGSTKDGVC